MNTTTHIGNTTLVLDRSESDTDPLILLGLKRPKDKKDASRKRKRIGIGRWVPPGGATEKTDKSQKHSAQRELRQETGLFFPLKSFCKVGLLQGDITSRDIPAWLVHIYVVDASRSHRSFTMSEMEYTDMRWFRLSQLPLEKMLRGDREWIPRVARGEKLSIRIWVDEKTGETTSMRIVPTSFSS